MPNEEEMKAEIERLSAENEALKKPARGQLSLRVSEKGRAFGLRAGTLSGDPVPRAVGETAGHDGPDPRRLSRNDAALKKKE